VLALTVTSAITTARVQIIACSTPKGKHWQEDMWKATRFGAIGRQHWQTTTQKRLLDEVATGVLGQVVSRLWLAFSECNASGDPAYSMSLET
jgi:hypothetical protein